jgi:hypothetical protein
MHREHRAADSFEVEVVQKNKGLDRRSDVVRAEQSGHWPTPATRRSQRDGSLGLGLKARDKT